MADVVVVTKNVSVVVPNTPNYTVETTPPDRTLETQVTNLRTVSAGTQGPAGPQGAKGDPGAAGGTSEPRTAATALGGHRLVRAEADGRVGYASNDNPAHGDDTVGMTLGAALENDPLDVQYRGVVTHTGWAWTPGAPVFLGRNGMPTQSASGAGDVFVQLIGFAETPTSLHLQIDSSIYL